MEGDLCTALTSHVPPSFQSTPSAWRVTDFVTVCLDGIVISIHTLRMEGDGQDVSPVVGSAISIHTLRMEGDTT